MAKDDEMEDGRRDLGRVFMVDELKGEWINRVDYVGWLHNDRSLLLPFGGGHGAFRISHLGWGEERVTTSIKGNS